MKLKRLLVFLLAISILVSCSLFSTVAAELDLSVVGASIRITGDQGLRFIGKVANNGAVNLTTGNNANFGILLIPKSMLADDTVEITKNTASVKIVPANNLMPDTSVAAAGLAYNSSYYYFTAVLTDMPEEFYGTEIVARAYVNNGGVFTYSAQITRSVASVAAGIAESASAPAEQKTVANDLLATYEERGIDILMQWSTVWNP